MEGWRPEEWPIHHYKEEWMSPTNDIKLQARTHDLAFEAGADAILEALKKKSAWMTPEQMRLIAPDRKYPYGYLVFIPEDKGR
jgi:hypothetical protein